MTVKIPNELKELKLLKEKLYYLDWEFKKIWQEFHQNFNSLNPDFLIIKKIRFGSVGLIGRYC